MATCGLFGRVDTVWSPSGPPRSWEAPLPDIWTDVGAAAGDGKDQALIAEDLDRPRYGVAANVVLLLERCGMKLSRCRGAPGRASPGAAAFMGAGRCDAWCGRGWWEAAQARSLHVLRAWGGRSPIAMSCTRHSPCEKCEWNSISMCSPHHLRPARAGRRLYLAGKHTTGRGRMRLARFGCRWGRGASLSSRQTYRAGFDANYEPTYGRCQSPGSAAEGSRPMRDIECCNERNPS